MYVIIRTVRNNPFLIGSALDSKIPFNIIGIIPYCIWYFFLFIIPFIYYRKDKKVYIKYLICYVLMSLVGDIIYFIYPTYVNRPAIEGSGILYYMAKIVFAVDNPPVNCFPSLHCAIAVLWILFTTKEIKLKWYYKVSIIIISLLIIPSTLIIKQHVIIDTVVGVILSLIIYIVISKLKINYNKIISSLKL